MLLKAAVPWAWPVGISRLLSVARYWSSVRLWASTAPVRVSSPQSPPKTVLPVASSLAAMSAWVRVAS